MSWSYSYRPDVWPAIVTLAVVMYLGLYSWRRRNIPGARTFAVGCALCGLLVLGSILELSAVDFPTQVFWHTFQNYWQLPVATAVTCFILQFAGLGRWLSLRTCALLFLVPLLNALAIATNDIHRLVWTGFEMSGHVVPSHGRLFWFFTSYVYVLGLVNLAILVWLAVRSPRHRWPVAIIVCGQAVARVGYTLEKTGTSWFGPGESALFTVGVVAASYAVAFLRFHVIDPVTAARTSLHQQMREGMFVLDLEGRILDVNPMAAAIVGIPEAALRNRRASEVLPLDASVLEGSADTETEQADLVLGNPGPARHYDLNVTHLRGPDGELIGRLLLLHDVTERKRAHARILDQQGVLATLRERERLARELHDGIGQTLGYVGLQAQAALQWVRNDSRERAEATLGRLAQVAHEAHAEIRESIFSLKGDSAQGWAFLQTLGRYVERFQANYGIRTELSIADTISEDTFEPAAGVQLMRVIQEALSNSRTHGGARTIRVAVGTDDGRARITITDDGQGFDTGRLEGGNGGHFGLTFMRERMGQIGGTLTIDSKPGDGTALTLDLPIREQRRYAGEGACS